VDFRAERYAVQRILANDFAPGFILTMRLIGAMLMLFCLTASGQKEVAPGIFELGKVRIDKHKRTIDFPAVVNMKEGLAEYFLVSTQGKLHESVLRTDVEPFQIHVAMLLLGGKGAQTNFFHPDKPPPGESITIEVSWKGLLSTKRVSAEEMVIDRATNKPMSKGTWTYTGSFQFEGMFVAQQTGSIISVIADPEALINNPRPRRDDDDNWVINSKVGPHAEKLVTITLKVPRIPPDASDASGTNSPR
jgi:hypothetical protein